MQKVSPAKLDNDREVKRKIERASHLVQEALGGRHTLRWRYAGPPQTVVESYLCTPTAVVTFPKLPMCVIGMLLEGRKVRNLRSVDNDPAKNGESLTTLPNRCVLLPKGVATHWRPTVGSVNLAGVYLSGPGQTAIEQMTAGATRPKPIRDAVLVALIRQLLTIPNARLGELPEDYEMHLVNALTAQLQWLGSRKSELEKVRSMSSDQAIEIALRLIEEHLDEPITIEWLCDSIRIGPALFRRRFRELTGKPVHQYILVARVERARELIEETSLPLAIVATHCGFSSQSHMTTVFRRVTGGTPREHRRASVGAVPSKF